MDEKLIREFISTMEQMKKDMYYSNLQSDIPHSEFALLDIVKSLADDNIKVTTSILSKMLKISKSAVSQTINALEKKGWVLRSIDAVDKRVYCVTLTNEGIHIINDLRTKHIKLAKIFLDKIGEEDTKALIRITSKVSDIINEQFSNKISEE